MKQGHNRLAAPEQVEAIIRNCAANIIMPRFQALATHEIETKSHSRDYLTIADTEAEQRLSEDLQRALPDSLVLGEESHARKEVAYDILEQSEHPVWILDPIDGTGNFVNGKTTFAVMVALIHDGQCRQAWIYDAPSGSMTYACKGEGAYKDQGRLHVTGRKELAPNLKGHFRSSLFAKISREISDEPVVRQIVDNSLNLKCTGHEYLRLSTEQSDFAIYKAMKPWDHVPGTLICEEAGACVAKWNGDVYRPHDIKGGLLVATSRELWVAIQSRLLNALEKNNSGRGAPVPGVRS